MTDLDRGRDYEPSVYATHEDEYDDYDVDEEEEGGSRAAVILLAVIGIVIVLGVAYVSYRLGYNNGVREASVPRLTASAEGGKVRPNDPGGMAAPEPSALDQSVTSGGDDEIGSLLPREEPVIDLAAVAADSADSGNSVPGVDEPITLDTLGADPDAVLEGPAPSSAKKPAKPAARVDKTPAPARTAAASTSSGNSDRIFVPRPGGGSPPPARAAPPKPKATTPPKPKVSAPSPARVAAPPPSRTTSVPGPSARIVPAPSSEPPPPASSEAGRYVVQLASLPSQTMADDAWTRISAKYPELLGNATRDIKEADLGAKGIYYRLRVGYFQDRSSATSLCETLKTRGQDCLVTTR